jgi:GntR family transcriptional regulator / MocR family aminotransferase
MDYALLVSAHERECQGRKLPRQRLLYEALRQAILDGRIAQGTRVLASRVLADELGIARNSVLYAYERLADEGFLRASRHGSVVAQVGVVARASAQGFPNERGELSRRVRGLARVRHSDDDLAPFRAGVPALDAFPLAPWRACVDRAWRATGIADLGYGNTEGHPALRRTIADYVRVSRGVRCDIDQVFITDGTQSSLDLCARLLADGGDTAWLENPGYSGARAAFQSAGLRIAPIPVDAHGIAPTLTHWRASPPRLIYVTPSHQYPLGGVLSLERRFALLEGARAHRATIIEDDYDSEFRSGNAPLSAVQGLADDPPVVYVGTFSKTMFPALRLGFMIVPTALAATISTTMGDISRRGRVADQLALAEFIDSGQYARHLRRMRVLYEQRRMALQAALERHMGDLATVSGGAEGMHLTIRLDAPLADRDVSRAALADKLAVQPISQYCLPGTDLNRYNGLVLGYANLPVERADELVGRLARVIRSLRNDRVSPDTTRADNLHTREHIDAQMTANNA